MRAKMILNTSLPLIFFGLAGPVVARVLKKENGCVLFFDGRKQVAGFWISCRDSNTIDIETVQSKAVRFDGTREIKQI